MGSYFSERWGALAGLPAAFADNPVFFIITFAIGVPLIWWKWRIIGKSQSAAIAKQTHGLRRQADRKQVRHETGVGTKDIIVMRRAKLSGGIWFGLIFFGGGAVFYAMVVLPESQEPLKDWGVFAIMIIFVIVAIAVLIAQQTCIYIDGKSLTKRRILRPQQTLAFGDVIDVQPARKKFSYGLVLHTNDGNKMKIMAAFSGYLELISRLPPINPQLMFFAKMAKSRSEKVN